MKAINKHFPAALLYAQRRISTNEGWGTGANRARPEAIGHMEARSNIQQPLSLIDMEMSVHAEECRTKNLCVAQFDFYLAG